MENNLTENTFDMAIYSHNSLLNTDAAQNLK